MLIPLSCCVLWVPRLSMLDSSVGEHEEAAHVSHSVVPPDGRSGFAAHCVSPKVSHSTLTLHAAACSAKGEDIIHPLTRCKYS